MYKQSIGLLSIKNARELGGYKTEDGRCVRRGVLLRTAKLQKASDEDIKKLIDVYRLGTIIDFRMNQEADHAADPVLDGVKYYRIGIINEMELQRQNDIKEVDIPDYSADPLKALERALESGIVNEYMYVGFLKNDVGKKGFRDFFKLVLSEAPDRAVLWHCTSGKDRTGLAAVLLLSALGVDEETCMEDFLLTNVYNRDRIEKLKSYLDMSLREGEKTVLADMLIVFDGVSGKFMENAIKYMKQEYGSVIGYIKEGLGITGDEIERLKEKYLD